MNVSETSQVKVEDVVIYVKRRGQRPVLDTVTKVTKTGQIGIAGMPGTNFKRNYNETYESTSHTDGKVYLLANGQPADRNNFSDHKLDELNAEAGEREAADAEEKAAKAKQAAKRDERIAAELAEVKAACGGILPVEISRTLPDGSRLVTLNLPVKPEHAERKGGFEVVICRLKDEDDYVWQTGDKKKVVALHMTYLHAGSSSFPSCSGTQFDNDDEALWEAVRDQYHSGW